MQHWGGGYVTDVEYAPAFYTAQSPTRLALAATINGFESPDLSGDFKYCELGCGNGGTLLVLAALHPQAEFHGVDFNPAHIAHAASRAKKAGLDNAHLHELDFSQLTAPGHSPLPMFDVIAMHGVWSWIAPERQQAILSFISARLNPGGLVYVGYNAMPGWTTVLPAQRIVWELTRQWQARSDTASRRAVDMLARLATSNGFPERLKDGAKRIQDAAERGFPVSYIAHEYLNEHWRPLYHLDVARAFAGAKLGLAASTDLLRNFQNMVLTPEQADLLEAIDSPDLRETLKDFYADNWFRTDVYVRGVRRMSAQRRETMLRDFSLALLGAAPGTFHINRPDGSAWRPDPEVYRPILEALRRRPHRISELLALPDLPAGHTVSAVELTGVLVGGELAGVYKTASPAELKSAARFNALIEAEAETEQPDSSTLAVATLSNGVKLTGLSQMLYFELRRGEPQDAPALAGRFVAWCKARGVHPLVNGEEIKDEQAARAAVAAEYAKLLQNAVPSWEALGII
jgi:SAM-dependent methyltransferase